MLFGIAEAEKTLSDTNAGPELRAVMMSYLVHLVGDEHQPLHCESFFSSDYPNGDKGGNDFYVKPASRVVGLHNTWPHTSFGKRGQMQDSLTLAHRRAYRTLARFGLRLNYQLDWKRRLIAATLLPSRGIGLHRSVRSPFCP